MRKDLKEGGELRVLGGETRRRELLAQPLLLLLPFQIASVALAFCLLPPHSFFCLHFKALEAGGSRWGCVLDPCTWQAKGLGRLAARGLHLSEA